MKVITSQSYIDDEIVEHKKELLVGVKSVDLIVWTTGLQDDDGNDLCILSDGHHTYEAAKELGLEINFIETEHPEGVTGEQLLNIAWMDSDYRYLDTGILVW